MYGNALKTPSTSACINQAAPTPSMLGEATARIKANSQHAYDLFTRLRNLNDRLLGSTPECGKDSNCVSGPSAAMGALEVSITDLSNILGMISGEVQRLENIA